MKTPSHFTSSPANRFVSLALSYALLLSLPPLSLRRVAAEKAPSIATVKVAARRAPARVAQDSRREGELLVRFRPGVSDWDVDSLLRSQGARRNRRLRGASGVERLALDAGRDPEAVGERLRASASVEFAEPNYIIRADGLSQDESVPSDPRFPEQWSLRDRDEKRASAAADIGAARAWSRTTGSPSTVIAIIDGGIDFTHPDLAGNQWTNQRESANRRDDDRNGWADDLHGWDWVAGTGEVKDEQGHGTAVAGIIAAEGDNARGISGVMWRASLMSLRVLDGTGTGDVASAVEAIDYATANGARAVNSSWGLDRPSVALKEAIERAAARGVVFVCSAGNGGEDVEATPHFPAAYHLPNLITVAATDKAERLASWSNYGARSISIAAPGADVLTTRMGGDYAGVDGSSASAALVTGVVGLIKTLRPRLTAQRSVSIVLENVRRVAALQGRIAAGGVVDAAAALNALGSAPPGRDEIESSADDSDGANDDKDIAVGNGGSGIGAGGQNAPNAPHHAQSKPGPKLPDLDDLRRHHPTPPKASDAIPSTLRPADLSARKNQGGVPGVENSRAVPEGRAAVTDPVQLAALAPRDKPDLSAAVRDYLYGEGLRVLSDNQPAPKLFAPAASRAHAGGFASLAVVAASDNFSVDRLEPKNRTGQEGVDLLSGNFNWSLPVVSLPGRAGLDLGLSLTYNSLVWTRETSGNNITFDADRGFPAPGFRLSFPTVQTRYYNASVGAYAYLLITPTGARVELRQVGASNVYEAADSSYLQLTDNGGGSLTLRDTHGTQFSYLLVNGEHRCTQVTDRNGNYITANYNTLGRLASVVDTLGRIVSLNYDGNSNLISITQSWNGQTHTWATFGYSNLTIQTNFPGLTLVGLQNGTTIPILAQVGLADGSRYNFSYNSWGQVYRVARSTHLDNNPAVWTERAYTSYNLPLTNATALSDCPRFTQRSEQAEDWNNGAPVVYAYQFDPAGAYGLVTAPDNTTYKELYATAGWQRGLVTQTESYDGAVRQKWTTTAWTQDNTGISYRLNPRPAEVNIYDSDGNRRRTTVEYHSSFGLPHFVVEYASDAVTTLRRTHIDYMWDAPFINRHIIGLVYQREVYDGSYNLNSKVRYGYDWGGEHMQDTAAQPTQHDSVNYGASFVFGRGNLCQIERFDVTDPNNAQNTHVEYKTGYNKAGSVIFTRDPLWHQTSIGYADSFSDNTNRNTFAYPTSVTDADSFSSTTQYNYDFGGVTRTQDPKGVVQTVLYDAAGRVERVTNQFNGAYQRWVYPSSLTAVQTYRTIQQGEPEAYSCQVFDGAGRVRATASDHPGSAGGYSGQYLIYDAVGRVIKQSNPTEMTAQWVNAGDDAAGWSWTQQAYDWKGRPTVTTKPKLNPNDPNEAAVTSQVSYGGCGCAGGEVVTTTDEVGRRQRVTSDALGRNWKTEILNPNGSVYRTTTNTYNVRDQLTRVYDQQGSNGAGQETLLTYDGHGRLATSKTPAESAATVYLYNADDTLQKATDARGAATTYTYNNRHLVTNLSYVVPAGVAATPSVAYGYDAAGNRTWMTDGMGRTDYAYDTLSQMTSETRQFNGLAASYTLAYSYNLGGELTSISDQTFGSSFGYTYDRTGRVSSVTGAGFAGVTSYASGFQYRAWGAEKAMTYGNGRTSSATYDARLEPAHFEVPGLISKDYQYNPDGRLGYSHDQIDARLDRSYTYDHAGRLADAKTGAEARGGAYDGNFYSQAFAYDVWGNTTARSNWHWSSYVSDAATYVNERNTAWTYDAAGRVTGDGMTQFTFDAAGRTQHTASARKNLTFAFDGDGRHCKSVSEVMYPYQLDTKYYLRSTVLGGAVIAEISSGGAKARGFVYDSRGAVLAEQWPDSGNGSVRWVHRDAANTGERVSWLGGWEEAGRQAEFDPLGVGVETQDPYVNYPLWPGPAETTDLYLVRGNPTRPLTGCNWSYGPPTNCSEALADLNDPNRIEGPTDVGFSVFIPPGLDPDGRYWNALFNVYWGRPMPGDYDVVEEFLKVSQTWPQKFGRVRLTGDALAEYLETRKHLLELLKDKDSDCAKFLKRVVGVSGSRIARTVKAQRAFDGAASTLSLEDAGILSRNSVSMATGLPSAASVKEYFGTMIPVAAQAGFARASTGATFNDVYYQPIAFFESQILHEALHTLLGVGDSELDDKHADVGSLGAAGCNMSGKAYH